MKWMLQLILLIVIILNGKAQECYKVSVAKNEPAINIPIKEVSRKFIAPVNKKISLLKSAVNNEINISVSYINFSEEAKIAFEYAVGIWRELIVTNVPIKIEAHFDYIEENVLAQGFPALFFANFKGTTKKNVYYPVSLAEKITGKEMNAGKPDIICQFNSKYNWYFGTDGNTPENNYDFVSSALHEMAHGLGIAGFFKCDDEKGFFDNSYNYPSIYDFFIFNNLNQKIADKIIFPSPSVELKKQLISDNLKFCKVKNDTQYNNIGWIYAPEMWNKGSSIYHLKEYTYGEENGLMAPKAKKGLAIHNPGRIVLDILNSIGWNAVDFDFQEICDREKKVERIPVVINVKSGSNEIFKEVRVFFSKDRFNTKSCLILQKISEYGYNGNMVLDNFIGKVEYYFQAETEDGNIYFYPNGAPGKLLNFRIGPDYQIPDLFHNPLGIINCKEKYIQINAEAIDNIGIKEVKAEFFMNGEKRDVVTLYNEKDDLYSGIFVLPGSIKENVKLEYRIVTTDSSENENIRKWPTVGLRKVPIFKDYEPVERYCTEFNGENQDFICSDFIIGNVNGIDGNVLSSKNPYPVSAIEEERYNMVARLKYPIVIKENGVMKFDEVVLVEPGKGNYNSIDNLPWDYVVVEASKDKGKKWVNISGEYNSEIYDLWYAAFTNDFYMNTSKAIPDKSMFVNRKINLTNNTGFEEGDTVVFRFRMASDRMINGFGWMIDNIEIQGANSKNEQVLKEHRYRIYPNPVEKIFFIEDDSDCLYDKRKIKKIRVTDMLGNIVNMVVDDNWEGTITEIDMTNQRPGIYLVSIWEDYSLMNVSKIVKN